MRAHLFQGGDFGVVVMARFSAVWISPPTPNFLFENTPRPCGHSFTSSTLFDLSITLDHCQARRLRRYDAGESSVHAGRGPRPTRRCLSGGATYSGNSTKPQTP